MCTISFHRDATRLLLTMNRDERRNRAAEVPPALRPLSNGRYWMGPADGEQGGTWLGLHCSGWAACLMNRYPSPGGSSRGSPSRGEIIPRLMSCDGPQQACRELLEGMDLEPYSPFTLLLISPGRARRLVWEGRRPARVQPLPRGWVMLTSSSWKEPEVRRWRQRHFRSWVEAGAPFRGELPSFNLLQPAGRAEWAPLMSRKATHTRSISLVRIDRAARRLEMVYWARPAQSAESSVRWAGEICLTGVSTENTHD